MNVQTLKKKIELLEKFASSVGAYYSINLTANLIHGKVYQTLEGISYDVSQRIGFPPDAEFSDYIAYWGNQLPEEEKNAYFSFFSVSHLLERYQNGENHLVHTYWTKTILGDSMLAEHHIMMYTDEETGDVLGISYIIDLTKQFLEREYREKLESKQQQLEDYLLEANWTNQKQTEQLQKMNDRLEEHLKMEKTQKEVLMALSDNYHAIFLIDLQHDSYTKISCRDEIKHYYSEDASAARMLAEVCIKIVDEKHCERMQDFFNLDTLQRRLKNREFAETECITKEGNWHRARFIAERRDAQGMVTHVLYVTQLIDDQKQYEEHLIARAEYADFANQAKTEFISQVAHDIRTPMNSIFGFLEIAEANMGNWEKVQYSLEKIRVAGAFLRELADDVLDISRMEHGKMKLQPQIVSLKKLLDDFLSSIQKTRAEKKQSFFFNSYNILYDAVIVDPLRLKQIYTNVLSNAIKYTPDDGSITFTVYQKSIPDSNKIRLISIIEDTGIGMSEEFMDRMFTKFERETDTRINKVSGYGLGLSIVKQLVELMGGTIEAQSRLEKGTKFVITLDIPYVEVSLEELSGQEPDYSALCAGMHLLVAEDNELNREVITELLRLHGITCECAEDGLICLKRFEAAGEGVFDAILMDMQMPNMNGLQATSRIRALPFSWAKTIPIIAMTANAQKVDIMKCLNAGMNKHLSKPMDIKLLLKTLAEYRRKDTGGRPVF